MPACSSNGVTCVINVAVGLAPASLDCNENWPAFWLPPGDAIYASSEQLRLCCSIWSGAVASVELAKGASNVVAQAVLANEAAMRKELQLSRFSMASSGTSSTEEMEIDPEYQCPICLVRCPMLRTSNWIEFHAHVYITI